MSTNVINPPPSGGLVWSSNESPGLTRRRSGRGFCYRDPKGRLIRERNILMRIDALAIPPAWQDVWICPDPNGHIQATGRDTRGRKQYRYHADWTARAASHKFARLPDFARRLPRLHDRVANDLSRRGPCKEKVLASAVRLLEITLIRVGNAAYARQNRSFGLTTLRKRHLEVDGWALTFEFRGKSGKEHRVKVSDRRLARVMRGLEGLPGQHLFKYRDAEGELRAISSDDVNAYIREAMGDQFSAKDFRTWAATVAAARAFYEMAPPTSQTEARRNISTCMKAVASLLGNTPTVCRASYVHPRVIELYESGTITTCLPDPNAQSFDSRLARLLSEPA
ncbi:DNA topoisomerase IB [Brevundimonas sp. 3P9-tot-E]|uniref:DNA topoisomerase IB n=2 Tax=Caulobacteraceae TaxID=76892 RepID=UPI0034D65CA5